MPRNSNVMFLVHLSWRLKCTIVITCCPSSVIRPSVVNFSHFQLLLWNHWTEFNKTWQEARYQRPLPSLCFSGQSEKQDGRPGLWLAETFSTSPLKPLNRIQQNLTGSKISMSSTKFVFFGPIGKTRWLPWPLIGWDIFDFSSESAERNSTKLDRKQDLNVLYQVLGFLGRSEKQDSPGLWLAETFLTSPLKPMNGIQRNLTGSKISMSSTKFVFFGPIRNKMAALASDWLKYFLLLLWNRWTEFNETWQEARSQSPLPSLCFVGQSVNKNVRLGRFLKKVAHCTQVHDMWPFGPLVKCNELNCFFSTSVFLVISWLKNARLSISNASSQALELLSRELEIKSQALVRKWSAWKTKLKVEKMLLKLTKRDQSFTCVSFCQ